MNIKPLFVFLFCVLVFVTNGAKQDVAAVKNVTIDKIIDGDTFCSGQTRFRLWGVDAPEVGQPWGAVATAAVTELLLAKQVEIVKKSKSYNRDVVFVISGGLDIGLELIKMGLAWYTPEYAPEREDYAAAQLEAKQAKRGLWSDKNPIAPMEWRENKKTKGEQK